jgi:hypothetical protein
MFHSLVELGWWQITFPQETTVRTVFIVPSEHCCPERNVFKLSVGNSLTASDNPVCVDYNMAPGVYECPSAMVGRYFSIYRTTVEHI